MTKVIAITEVHYFPSPNGSHVLCDFYEAVILCDCIINKNNENVRTAGNNKISSFTNFFWSMNK